MKRAMVLSGGGSRGIYEIGAWQAALECGVQIDMAYGTSIGAINAALVAQGDFDLAAKLWNGMDVTRIFADEDAKELAIENMVSRKRDILPFLIEHARQLNMDPSPLENLMRESISEERIRRNGVDFGITATRIPTLAPVRRRIGEMKPGSAVDWIMASCACFPVFPLRQVDGDTFMDGGFADNLPLAMAFLAGADDVVAVDVHPQVTHPEFACLPSVTWIAPRAPLAGFLDFDPGKMEWMRRTGYYDGMKAFGRFDGLRYTFRKTGEMPYAQRPRAFLAACAALDATCPGGDLLVTRLRGESPLRPMSFSEIRIRGLEIAMELFGYRTDAVYSAEDVTQDLAAFTLRQEGDPAREIGELRAQVRETGRFSPESARKAAKSPREAIAALYLHYFGK